MDPIKINLLVTIKNKKKKKIKSKKKKCKKKFPKQFYDCTIFKKDPEYKRRDNISDNHISFQKK